MTNGITDIQALNQNYKNWFGELVDRLNVDKFLLENNVASTDTKKMYDTLIFGKESEIYASTRITSSMFFVKGMLKEYFDSIKNYPSKPRKLALELSDAKILVWAEIEDDDELAEDALILSEAKANGKFGEYGFHISSTIVEKSDNLTIPSQYQVVIG